MWTISSFRLLCTVAMWCIPLSGSCTLKIFVWEYEYLRMSFFCPHIWLNIGWIKVYFETDFFLKCHSMVFWLPVLLLDGQALSDSWSFSGNQHSLWSSRMLSLISGVLEFYRVLVYAHLHPLCWAWSELFPSGNSNPTILGNILKLALGYFLTFHFLHLPFLWLLSLYVRHSGKVVHFLNLFYPLFNWFYFLGGFFKFTFYLFYFIFSS